MFIVELTFDRAGFRVHARSSAAVSIGVMIAPFAVAALMIPWLLTHPGLFSPEVSSGQAALFLGSAIPLLSHCHYRFSDACADHPRTQLCLYAAWAVIALVHAILVLMAIVTTLMAAPLFELVYGRAARKRGVTKAISGGV